MGAVSATAFRIAEWIWRDLSLRAGFREVVDQIPDRLIVDYWAARIAEEIGDNRFIAALEKIRDLDYRGNRHESAFIAIRALGPAKVEQAAKHGVTQFAADGDAHRAEQLALPTSTPPEPAAERPVEGPTPTTGPVEAPPPLTPDDF